jgi:hypothetical protein
MHEYEIRILQADARPAIIMSEIQLNDAAAIRSARKAAMGRAFEIWRGLDRIHSDHLSPKRSAA